MVSTGSRGLAGSRLQPRPHRVSRGISRPHRASCGLTGSLAASQVSRGLAWSLAASHGLSRPRRSLAASHGLSRPRMVSRGLAWPLAASQGLLRPRRVSCGLAGSLAASQGLLRPRRVSCGLAGFSYIRCPMIYSSRDEGTLSATRISKNTRFGGRQLHPSHPSATLYCNVILKTVMTVDTSWVILETTAIESYITLQYNVAQGWDDGSW